MKASGDQEVEFAVLIESISNVAVTESSDRARATHAPPDPPKHPAVVLLWERARDLRQKQQAHLATGSRANIFHEVIDRGHHGVFIFALSRRVTNCAGGETDRHLSARRAMSDRRGRRRTREREVRRPLVWDAPSVKQCARRIVAHDDVSTSESGSQQPPPDPRVGGPDTVSPHEPGNAQAAGQEQRPADSQGEQHTTSSAARVQIAATLWHQRVEAAEQPNELSERRWAQPCPGREQRDQRPDERPQPRPESEAGGARPRNTSEGGPLDAGQRSHSAVHSEHHDRTHAATLQQPQLPAEDRDVAEIVGRIPVRDAETKRRGLAVLIDHAGQGGREPSSRSYGSPGDSRPGVPNRRRPSPRQRRTHR